MGKRNNQNWVSIPHDMLEDQIKYKCEDVGIEVLKQEESYTSKASFLDRDKIPVYKFGFCTVDQMPVFKLIIELNKFKVHLIFLEFIYDITQMKYYP